MSRKFLVSAGILLLSIAAVFFLWERAIVLSVVLLLIAYAKHRLYPIKFELVWFLLICVGGAVVEILLVNFGGAWRYTSAQFFNIPIWMPLFWGVVGTTVVVIHGSLGRRI